MGWSLSVADGWDLLLVALLIFFSHSMNPTLKEDVNHLWIQSDHNEAQRSFPLLSAEAQPCVKACEHLPVNVTELLRHNFTLE